MSDLKEAMRMEMSAGYGILRLYLDNYQDELFKKMMGDTGKAFGEVNAEARKKGQDDEESSPGVFDLSTGMHFLAKAMKDRNWWLVAFSMHYLERLLKNEIEDLDDRIGRYTRLDNICFN